MSKARIRKMNLPDAPKPTRAVRAEDPRDIERGKRIMEHKEFNFSNSKNFKVIFWDEARLCKLRRLWNEGCPITEIARECGCDREKALARVDYEVRSGNLERRHKAVSAEDKAKIYKLFKAGMTRDQLAKDFKIHKGSINRIVRKMREKEGKKK